MSLHQESLSHDESILHLFQPNPKKSRIFLFPKIFPLTYNMFIDFMFFNEEYNKKQRLKHKAGVPSSDYPKLKLYAVQFTHKI
jgi:hypothetical protein